MTAGPEFARLAEEFEQTMTSASNSDRRHHEQTEAHQKRFKSYLDSLREKLSYLGNPFAEESEELLSVYQRRCKCRCKNSDECQGDGQNTVPDIS